MFYFILGACTSNEKFWNTFCLFKLNGYFQGYEIEVIIFAAYRVILCCIFFFKVTQIIAFLLLPKGISFGLFQICMLYHFSLFFNIYLIVPTFIISLNYFFHFTFLIYSNNLPDEYEKSYTHV